MKAADLITELQEYDDPEAEVVLMSQPDRHPLFYRIRSRVDSEDVGGKTFIILEEGSQIGYSLEDA